MTAHSENTGSRKVEPETQNLPKWRLKANYLMRQLARIWYGKLPVREYPKSSEFERLFIGVMFQFVIDHGGNGSIVLELLRCRKQDFEDIHGRDIRFSDVGRKLDWMVRNGVPTALRDRLENDDLVESIIQTAEWILHYEEEEKEPPYVQALWMNSLDYYEELPVLEPEPEWWLLANELLRDLVRVWYGKETSLPMGFYERLMGLLLAFAQDKGIERTEFMEKLDTAEADFEWMHGCNLTFRTPIRKVVWAAEQVLPIDWVTEFLQDARVKRILAAAELIYVLSKAGIRPPYEKYSVSFEPLGEYESLPVLTANWGI